MHTFNATTVGARATVHRPGRPVFEVAAGETILLTPIDSPLDSVSQASGPSSPTISGMSIGPISTTGRYRFVVTMAGTPVDFHVLVYETGCIAAIPSVPLSLAQSPASWSRGQLTAAEKRVILRNIANSEQAPWFDGTAASLTGKPLLQFGGY